MAHAPVPPRIRQVQPLAFVLLVIAGTLNHVEADGIAELYLCDDVLISLRLRVSGSARQLVEESEMHAFLPRFVIGAMLRHPITSDPARRPTTTSAYLG